MTPTVSTSEETTLGARSPSAAASSRVWRRDLACMLGLMALYLAWNFACGEIILLGDGLGVDGIEYARIVGESPAVLDHGLGPLYAARVAAPLLVRGFNDLVGLPLDTKGVITGFQIVNGLITLATVWLWSLLAGRLRLSSSGHWLGFLVLFINCAQLEYHLYYPVLTDVLALFLSLAMLYAHLRGRLAVLFVLALIGGLTWPTLLYLGLVLFLFPHRRQAIESAPLLGSRLIGLGAAFSVVAALGYGAVTGTRQGLTGEWAQPGLVGYAVLALGSLIAVLYAYAAGRTLSDQRRYFAQPFSFLSPGFVPRLALAALGYLGVHLVSGLFLDPSQSLTGSFFVGSVMRAAQRPAVFYVMHVSFFGPVVIFAAYHWRHLLRLLHSHGLGLTLYGALSAILLIQPLTRQSITLLPLLAILCTLVLEARGRLSKRELWVVAAVSLLMSRFWMPVNALQARWPIDGDPIFWFRINYGKYFSDLVYWPQLGLIALLTVAGGVYLRRRDALRQPPSEDEIPEAALLPKAT